MIKYGRCVHNSKKCKNDTVGIRGARKYSLQAW